MDGFLPWPDWTAVHLDIVGIMPTISKRFGVIMLPFAVYNFSLTAVTLVMLAWVWMDKRSFYRKQEKYLFIGLLIPAFSTLLFYIGLDFYNIDLTPFSFAITGLLLIYGIFRHSLFDLVPVALSHIVSEMRPGLIVYNSSFRLADINPSAALMLSTDGQCINGRPFAEAFAHVPELLQLLEQKESCKNEIEISGKDERSYYEVTVSQLENAKGACLDWMAQIYDITERKAAEEKLRHDRERRLFTLAPMEAYKQLMAAYENRHSRFGNGDLYYLLFILFQLST